MLINSKLALSCLPLAVLALTGCRQDMHDQPKFKPLGETKFFTDGRQSRADVPHTIARGDLRDGDPEFYTGKSTKLDKDGKESDVEVFPITVDKALIERGHERFDVFCSPCHGRLGNGMGMIVRRGFKQPPSFHTERLRTAPVGHFFDVETNGYGAMYSYAAQVPPHDRWAIISYIRVLQFSENQKVDTLSAENKAKLPAKPNPEEEPILPGGRADQETAAPAAQAAEAKPGAMNK